MATEVARAQVLLLVLLLALHLVHGDIAFDDDHVADLAARWLPLAAVPRDEQRHMGKRE